MRCGSRRVQEEWKAKDKIKKAEKEAKDAETKKLKELEARHACHKQRGLP